MGSKLLSYHEISCKYYDNQSELDVIKRLCEGFENKKILEVGCGIGRLAGLITSSGGEYSGVDKNQEFINYCKKKFTKLTFRKADAEKLPFKSEEFDVVISPWLLPDVKNPLFAIKEACRVLKRDCAFVVIDGTFLGEYGKLILEFFKKRKIHREWYFQQIRDHLVSVFRNIQSFELVNIPYIFPDEETAAKEIIMELEVLEKIKLTQKDKEKIKQKIRQFRKDGEVVINECVAFHSCKKL